jgi:crotonobetaine/carnitine-CoA ligase
LQPAFEVEEALLKHADVMECAAYGVESELTEEDVMVSVVLRPGSTLSEEEVFAYALENLGRHQVPRYIEFVDSLPRTATGKLEVHSIKTGWKGRENVKEFSLPRRMDSTIATA